MIKSRVRERTCWGKDSPRIEKQCWKVIGLLVILWLIGVNFRQYMPFSIRRNHEIRTVDTELEESIANGELSPFDANGFLNAIKASRYCDAHNWKTFPKRDSRRKIYDLVMVNSELDWLEIRLNELHHHVDYFVVLESATTFTGHQKPLYVKENWLRFEKFDKQIIYHLLEDPPTYSNVSWTHESHQRNAMYTQVLPFLKDEQAPHTDDIILVSDLDEIPRPATLTLLRNCEFPRRLTLRSRFYYYGFQWLHRGVEWQHPQATTYRGSETILPSELRGGTHGINKLKNMDEKDDLWNAAWHCSSCFPTIEEMLRKMSSFSHTELNKQEFRNKKTIADRVRAGKDLWMRWGERYDRIEHNRDIPRYLKENSEKFSYLLDRDKANAGFVDYEP
jgi:beta-1,4-mannosyl-glycoprotein beta-1,4-N-acetylglucosaminyltransferase